MPKLRIRVVLAVLLIALGWGFGCGKLKAKDRLNEGTRAYNRGEYEKAEQLFRESIEASPDFPQARLYLAAAIRAQFVPGGDSEQNKATGRKAIQAYEDVIKYSTNPSDIDAAHAFIADIYKGLEEKEKHREWTLKRINLKNQKDEIRAQSYYTLAVGYWDDSYKITQKYLIPKTNPPQYKAVKEWEKGDEEKVKEAVMKGLQYMEESIKINPKYANCYSYRALLYREQAKLESDEKVKEQLRQKADADIEEFQRLNREAQAAQTEG
ncbi:MAG: hypothetical protein RMM17_09380 [Acidobacteriota bacterium]|nr:hypothetical protein [Blastocatellia bacterium]MDW8412880.1 hypothetical protein [Acidobacteriota bacterium]